MTEPIKPKVVKTQRVHNPNALQGKPKFDQVTTIQQAINMAVAENRVIRFKTAKSNKELKNEIDFLKGCALRKPDRDSYEVAVIPEGVEDFCFDEVIDESIDTKSRIIIPKPLIYT
jgi:hypothetical protein